MRTGCVGVFFASKTEKVPGGVLDVVGVDAAVGLKLLATECILFGVVAGDAAFPVVGLLVRMGVEKGIVVGERLGEVSETKMEVAPAIAQANQIGANGERGIEIRQRCGESALKFIYAKARSAFARSPKTPRTPSASSIAMVHSYMRAPASQNCSASAETKSSA